MHSYNKLCSPSLQSAFLALSTEAGNVTAPSCMILDKSFNLSLCQYFFFSKMEKKIMVLTSSGCDELIFIKCMEHCLAYSKHSISVC